MPSFFVFLLLPVIVGQPVKVWDIKIGKQISAFSGDSRFYCGGFSPDGTMIVAGEASGRVHLLLFDRGS